MRDVARQMTSPVGVVVFGQGGGDLSLPEHWLHKGLIHDEELLNLWYNVADVFVLPSMADNLPNTLLEASAAGTPSVVFDTGGCAEIVRDGETGFVVEKGDVAALADRVLRVLTMPEAPIRTMQARCRSVAESEYGLVLQARRYAALFDALCSQGTHPAGAHDNAPGRRAF